MKRKVVNQGAPIGIAVGYVDTAGDPYNPEVTFFAIDPLGRKHEIPGEQVENPETGSFTAWYSSKSMHGLWRIEGFADEQDDVPVVEYTVLPTHIG